MRPFAITRSDGLRAVRCPDGGAWDRSTWYGIANDMDEARKLAATKLATWQSFMDNTSSNLKIAWAVEPGNVQLINYVQRCEELRILSLPTLPMSIEQEKRIDPLPRTRLAGVAQAARDFNGATSEDEAAVFAAIQQWKNEFR